MLALALIAAPGRAIAADHFTPLSARVLHAPEPVRGGDGRMHLAYELVLANDSAFPPGPVTVRRIIARAAGKPVETLAGAELEEMMEPFGVVNERTPRTTIQPGGTAKVLMDVSYPAGAPIPRRLDHEIVLSPGPPAAVELSRFTAAPTAVRKRPAVIVAPPLRGPGWVVINGCCAQNTSHRRSLLAIDGGLHAGERYAIDFVQMTPAGQLTEGPADQLASYPFYGDEVLSATAGKVVGVVDRLPDGPINFALPPITAGDAGGNHVVVAMGGGRYAFYAHLVPGSVRVKVGERVRPGQVLGLLGNSGNSNAPHLHFQLMDGPSPLGSEGIPYRFSSFTAEGTLADFPQFFVGGAAARLAGSPRGPRHAELPLNLQIVGLGP
ncbi:MAG: M23 family metallopeptidase [Actinobacteria bacterium]|nr:M23 family metallopeptidase [Actinomycetota bacterium]